MSSLKGKTMTKLQGFLLAIFAIAATTVGFAELASAEQMQAAFLSALITAAGMVAVMLLFVNLAAENEQSADLVALRALRPKSVAFHFPV